MLYFVFGEKDPNEFFKQYRDHMIEYAQVRFSCLSHGFTIVKHWRIEEVTKMLNEIKEEFIRNSNAQEIFNSQKVIRKEANELREDILKLIREIASELSD